MVFCLFQQMVVILPDLGHFCPISTFSAMSCFHTWSLFPHHIKSPKIQKFLPVKVQTFQYVDYCYIEQGVTWTLQPRTSSDVMFDLPTPAASVTGHAKENHLRIPPTEKHFYTPCSNVEQGLMKKNLIHWVFWKASQEWLQLCSQQSTYWCVCQWLTHSAKSTVFAVLVQFCYDKICFAKTYQEKSWFAPVCGFLRANCGFLRWICGVALVRKKSKIDDLLFWRELRYQIISESYKFYMSALGVVNNANAPIK